VNQQLDELGWTVIRFWEHTISKYMRWAVLVVEAMAHTPYSLRNSFEPDEDFSTFTPTK
jgi:very-short-patch-repair endonuclease